MDLSPDAAKRFFMDRIIAEAERQGIPLSNNERRMLNWSEVEPGCESDPDLAEALESEISDQAYEAKICGLLEAAYERELSADAAAKESYRAAYSVLKRGDYYVMIMIEQALGAKLRPRRWWQFA